MAGGLFWILIALNAFLRFHAAFAYNPMNAIWSDPATNWNFGTRPLDNAPLSALVPIMYPMWLGLVARLTQARPSSIALYAGLLSTLTPWIWYRFFRELLPTPCPARFGWLVLAWLPSWIGIFSYFMAETLLLPLLGLSLWFTWRCARKKSFASFVLALVIWCFTFATKMTVFPVAVIALAWCARSLVERRRALLFSVLFLPAFVFPLPGARIPF